MLSLLLVWWNKFWFFTNHVVKNVFDYPTVYNYYSRVIYALLYWRTDLSLLEFAKIQLSLNRDNLKHWKPPADKKGKMGDNKTGAYISRFIVWSELTVQLFYCTHVLASILTCIPIMLFRVHSVQVRSKLCIWLRSL